jgi:hypothetical protein
MSTLAPISPAVDKENQTSTAGNAAPASSNAKRASLKDAPDAAGTTQKKAAAPKSTGTAALLSPYEKYKKELDVAKAKMGPDAILLGVTNLEGFLESSGIVERVLGDGAPEDLEELSSEDYLRVLQGLSQEQVDAQVRYTCVPGAAMELADKFNKEILYADERNTPGDGFLMLNTHSSWCMYPVISKQFTAAVKEINKATKQIHGPSTEIPNVGIQALQTTVAAIMAANDVDHWRCDTEAPEEIEKLAKRMVKFLRDLLWLTDAEFGFTDVRFRQGLVHYLEEVVCKNWTQDCEGYGYSLPSMNLRTAKNGNGMGRALVDQNPAPAKKAKTVPAVAAGAAAAEAAAAAAPVSSGGTASLVSYFSAIHDKIDLRVKTNVQLKITNHQDPKKTKSEYVVLSGAQDMKKVHHLVAYLTGCSPAFEYHSQRGTSTKGCRFELQVPGYKTCWIAEKASAKQAAAAGADAVVDKSVKIVQIFQALNINSGGGLVFDSDLAKTICRSTQALQFVTPTGQRFGIQVLAVCPSKADTGRSFPMPRVVVYKEGQRKTGFGVLPLQQTKRVVQGDRKNPKLILIGGVTAAEVNKICYNGWIKPLCDEHGGQVCSVDRGSYSLNGFTTEAVLSAGPPSGVLGGL